MKKVFFFSLIIFPLLTACSQNRQKLSPQGNLYLKSANVYIQQKDDEKSLEKALMLYEKVLEVNPNHVLALKRSADINYLYATQIEPTKTEKEDKTVIYDRLDSASKAVTYFKKTYGKYDSVLTVIDTFEKLNEKEKTIKRDSSKKKENSYIKMLKISQYLADKKWNPKPDYELSINTLEYLHELDPERWEPMRLLVAVYQETQDTTNFEIYLKKVLAVNPDDPDLMDMIAAFHYNNKEYDKAAVYFKKIMVSRPLDVNNMLLLAETYVMLNENQSALNVLEKALVLEPNNLNVLNSAKNISLSLNNLEAEMLYWARILSLDTSVKNLEAYVIRKVILNDFTNLMQYAEQWFEKDSSNKDAVIACFNIAKAIGRKDLEFKYNEIFKSLNP